ncbi:MAG: Ig-like domain-containing protein [Euryarchaeota archaeon]
MKQKLIALFLIIVMVASALTAAGLATTTTVVAATATQTTLSVSKTNAKVNEPVTFTVTLKKWNAATGSYVALANKDVTPYHTFNGHLYTDVKKKTDASGKFTFSQSFSSIGQRLYYAKFAGDSSYALSQSSNVIVTVKYGTTLSLVRERSWEKVALGQGIRLTGYLKDQNGKPLANTKILFYSRTSPSAPWGTGYAGYTDSNGRFTAYAQTNQPTVLYDQVRYAGDSTHWGASSVQVQLIWKNQPQLNFLAFINEPFGDPTNVRIPVNTEVTLFGYLKDQNYAPLEIKIVTYWWRSSLTESWKMLGNRPTDTNGRYISTAAISSQPTTRYYYTSYYGDSTYWGVSSNVVKVTWY